MFVSGSDGHFHRRSATGAFADDGEVRCGRISLSRIFDDVGVDGDRDDCRHRDVPVATTNLAVGGVDPRISPLGLDRAIEERPHLVIDLVAQPADRECLNLCCRDGHYREFGRDGDKARGSASA